MTLIPIEHERRLASAAEAEAFFLGLGEKRISIRGLHTMDPARFGHVIAAIEPKHDHTVTFEGGSLGAAHDALDRLALSAFHYLDARTTSANLRIWPALHSWIHASYSLEVASIAFDTVLHVGQNTVGDASVTILEDGKGYPVDIETKSVTTALQMFRRVSGTDFVLGTISGVHSDTKPLLFDFLVALGTRLSAVLEIGVASARALSERYAGEPLDWQAGELIVDLPDGRIHGYLVTPQITERDHERWQARVRRALARAGLA